MFIKLLNVMATLLLHVYLTLRLREHPLSAAAHCRGWEWKSDHRRAMCRSQKLLTRKIIFQKKFTEVSSFFFFLFLFLASILGSSLIIFDNALTAMDTLLKGCFRLTTVMFDLPEFKSPPPMWTVRVEGATFSQPAC